MRSPISNSDAVYAVDVKLTADELSISRRARAGSTKLAASSGAVASSAALVLSGAASGLVASCGDASSGAAW
eukprot:2682568-Pleurochrysis_carterae.AAC.1